MKKEDIIKLICGMIAALFLYAAMSKLVDYQKSIGEMRNQLFPAAIAEVLTWLIPAIEITLALLLLFPSTCKIALWASLLLLSAFTVYIGVVMTGVFGRIPCSCGGILKNMGYRTHLLFNLFFVSLALSGLAMESGWTINHRFSTPKKERSLPKN